MICRARSCSDAPVASDYPFCKKHLEMLPVEYPMKIGQLVYAEKLDHRQIEGAIFCACEAIDHYEKKLNVIGTKQHTDKCLFNKLKCVTAEMTDEIDRVMALHLERYYLEHRQWDNEIGKVRQMIAKYYGGEQTTLL